MSLRDLIIDDLGGGIPDGRELKAVIPGGSSTVILTRRRDRRRLRLRLAAAAGTAMGSAGVIVCIDDRCCMVQLGIRVSEFYKHESCGKCTPCREGTRWLTAILRKLEDGRRDAGRPRPAARRLRPDHRQVPLPARRHGGDGRRELRRQVPRRVPARTSTRGGCPFGGLVRSTACSRRSRSTRTTPARGGARVSAPELVTVTIDERRGRRCRRAPGSSRRRAPPGSRSPSSATSRGSGRRSAPAACASSRSRACRSCRPAAR